MLQHLVVQGQSWLSVPLKKDAVAYAVRFVVGVFHFGIPPVR